MPKVKKNLIDWVAWTNLFVREIGTSIVETQHIIFKGLIKTNNMKINSILKQGIKHIYPDITLEESLKKMVQSEIKRKLLSFELIDIQYKTKYKIKWNLKISLKTL